MLTISPNYYFADLQVTAYEDDTDMSQFYIIPDYISIRLNEQNHPVFLLIEYAFSDHDRAANKNLPIGGGYMNFDTELSIHKEDEPKLKDYLQKIVNSKWHQLKALADAAGQDVRGYRIKSWHGNDVTQLGVDDVNLGLDPNAPGAPPGDGPPKVNIGYPTWTSGTFHVSAPQSDALISHRLVDGPLSLIGDNVAVVNMDLTSAGATFMRKTLTNEDGTGATDSTPIQVTYELEYLGRAPAAKLHISADSRTLYAALKEIDHQYQSNDCSEDVMSHYETQLKMAIQSGLIQVHIDTGTLDLKDDVVQKLTDLANTTVTKLIQDVFFEKKEAPPPPTDDPTKDFVNADKEIYYLKTDIDFNSVHFGLDETIEGIQKWKVNPQGTVQTFLASVPASQMKDYVRVLDLSDPLFNTLNLTVNAFAKWDEPIDFVECEVRYTGIDENNQQQVKVQGFTLTKDHPTDKWDPRLLKNKREYEYHWRVGFTGHGTSDFTDWQTETTPNLNLSVVTPGKIDIKVLANNIDFAQHTKTMLVELKYDDPNLNTPVEGTMVLLADGQRSGSYTRYIYIPWTRPVNWRSHCYLKTGQVIDSDWKNVLEDQLPIDEPFLDALNITLVTSGSWDSVALAVVNLAYVDETNNYHVDETYQLKSVGDFKSWSPPLLDKTNQKFKYKYIVTFKDGTAPVESSWTELEGDQTITINVGSKPTFDVTILPTLLDFKLTPVVECNMHYDDSPNNVHKVQTFAFTKNDNARWNFALQSASSPMTYRYALTYHTATNKTITQTDTMTDSTVLTIPPPSVPFINCLVNVKDVNFVETPVVQLDISYQDPAHNINYANSLVFTDPTSQSFTFWIADDSPTSFTATLTYYLASGQVVSRPPVTYQRTQFVIPRYLATSS